MILSSCLIFELFSVPLASAAPGQSERVPQHGAVTADIGELPNKLPKSPQELVSKRTQYSTRYLNPNGSFTEKVWLDPHFYQDSSDKSWKTIDNTLKESTKSPGKHINTANNVNTLFADDSGAGDLATVAKGNDSVTLAPVGVQNVKGMAKGNEMTYAGLFPNADAKYSVKGQTLKEDLVLQNDKQNTFTYEIKTKGVNAKVDKDGTISFYDTKGQKVWYFEKPFMNDSKGKYSNKVTLTLRQENGKTFVDMAADQAFLQDKTTQYPVTIDPSVTTWNVQKDNWVASNFPTSVFSTNTYMDSGYNSYFGSTRALVEFFLPSLPSDSLITSANFQAYQTQADASSVSVDLLRVTGNWNDSVTWNAQPTVGSTPESTVTSNASNAYWQWDVTQLTKDWYNASLPNYGFMLKAQNETSTPYQSFNTVENSNYTPQLTINYTVDPIGLENYWSLTKDGVNPANGNLVLQKKDLSIPGRGVPVSLTRTYNSRKETIAGMFGYGWISEWEARLIDAGNGPITYIDEDNTRHIFGQQVGGGYIVNDGTYLTLVKNTDGTYVMTKPDGTKYNFHPDGWMKSIVDTNGNTTTLTWDSSGNLSTLTDASGRQTTLTYNSNGDVTSMTDPASHTISYSYDASGNLTKVTDAAGNATTYAYDTNHNLTGVTNSRNITETINYDASNRVSSMSQPITINGTAQTSTTSYSYDTTNEVTSVTDGNGNRVDYSYNANGNVVQVTEDPLDSANKATTTYSYDNNNNLTQVIDPNTNKANGTSAYVYTYDSNGNITSKKLPGGQTSYDTYDSQNNLTQSQDFNSNISSYDYDTQNNQTESTDPDVQSAASRYDSMGNLKYSTNPMSAADNLVTNSSFEIGSGTWPDHWTQATQSGTTATFAWSSTSKFGKP